MTLGIQWHPESSLPGMPGREVSPEQDKASDRLFRAYAISGQTRLRQNAVIAELHVRRLYVVLGMRDMAHAEAVWMDIYGYYGREPTQRDIDDYLRAFNLSYT